MNEFRGVDLGGLGAGTIGDRRRKGRKPVWAGWQLGHRGVGSLGAF